MIPAEKYLEVLNPEQRAAVEHTGSPLLILAGAGSGKTRVITTKIAWLIGEQGYDPRSILAVTFTKKAANEMRERACFLNEHAQFSQIRTFHSFGSWFLRIFSEYTRLSSSFTVYDDDDVLTLIAKSSPQLTRVQCAHFAALISRAKDYCLAPDEVDKSGMFSSEPYLAEIYQAYEERLAETGNADFGDLIYLPVKLLRENQTVLEQIHRRFKVIMVDEYQDSNVAQFELLKLLVGPETYVCVVGDDDQSIYSFRGAEVKNILTFQQSFEGSQLIKLERNYRSVSPILKAADQVVANNSERLGKNLQSERGDGKKPVVIFLGNQDEECAFCAELIQQAHKKGCPYQDWAVLYRTNAQSLGFETEFLNRKIPYKVVGSLKFYDREEIKDLLAYLALALNPRDEICFSRIVNKPARGLGAVTQRKIIETARAAYAAIQQGEIYGENFPDSAAGGDSGTLDFSAAPKKQYGLLDACRALLPTLPAKAKKGMKEFLEVMDGIIEELDAADLQTSSSVSDQVKLLADAAAGTYDHNLAPNPEETLAAFIENLIKISGLGEYHASQDEIAGTQRSANMQELANSAVLYQKNRAGLTLFFDHIELDRSVSENEDAADAVTLITLHNTKGLEFPRVIISGIEQGVFPRGNKIEDELEEERRLFYVGITRAKDELYLSTCSTRRLYGRTEWMEPSIFLSELSASSVEIVGKKPARFHFAKEEGAKSQNNGGDEYLNGSGGNSASGDPLLEYWKPGTKIYHDDYGYGFVTKATYDNDDLLITVHFETGMTKNILPEYKSSQIMRIGQ